MRQAGSQVLLNLERVAKEVKLFNFSEIASEYELEVFGHANEAQTGFKVWTGSTSVSVDVPVFEKIGDTLHLKGSDRVSMDILYKAEVMVIIPPKYVLEGGEPVTVIVQPVKMYRKGEFIHEPIITSPPEMWKVYAECLRDEFDIIYQRADGNVQILVSAYLIKQGMDDAQIEFGSSIDSNYGAGEDDMPEMPVD